MVSWLLGVSGDPSNAWRAAEISPMLISASAHSTLFSTLSTLFRLRRFLAFSQQIQPLSVGKLAQPVQQLVFRTLPPRASEQKHSRDQYEQFTTSNANLMADLCTSGKMLEAPSSQLLFAMTSRTFTMSRLMNPFWTCTERLIIAAGNIGL